MTEAQFRQQGGIETLLLPSWSCSERDFQRTVIDLARTLGWQVAHFRPAWTKKKGQWVWRTPVEADGAGWPDLFFVRPPRLLVVETKSEEGKTSKAQQKWLDLLAECPAVEVYVWKPRDWTEVKQVLDR